MSRRSSDRYSVDRETVPPDSSRTKKVRRSHMDMVSPNDYLSGYRGGYIIEKKRKRSRIIILLSLLILLAGGLFYALASNMMPGMTPYLPFPKELVAVRLQLNGKEVLLKPGSQCVVNPRDTLQLLEVKTDGWISLGTKVVSPDFNVSAIQGRPEVIRGLMPQESFETPKTVEIRTLFWNKPIGKVSLVVQLDARDWLQKANATGDAGKKISYLEKALQENSGNILVKTQLAGLYYETKKYDEAAKLYKEIDDAGKTKPVLERLLSIYQIKNRVDDSLLVYLDLLKLTEDPGCFKEFLKYLEKHKSKEEAERYLERHQQDIPKAFHSSLLLVQADLSSQSKNWSRAAAAYEKVVKAGVKDPDVLYNLAMSYEQNDETDKAIQTLERYLQRNPSDIKSWMQLGAIQEKKGNLNQARTTYETVLQKNPQNKDALLRLIAILQKSNDKPALQAAYEKLAQQQPKNRTIQHNLAVLYYESKDWDKAGHAFEAIAAMDPKDVESRKYLLDIYKKEKNEKGRIDMLRSLADLEPGNTSYYDALFADYDARKDYKDMAALFKTATERHPDSVPMHNYLLYALMKLGDSKGALKELDNLSKLQPKEKKYLRQAANLYEKMADYGQALKKLDQLIKLDPKDQQTKDEYMRVRMLMLGKKSPA
jgi:tetratricopeptide (TPR) repeat protein